jgi:hypothetical protein
MKDEQGEGEGSDSRARLPLQLMDRLKVRPREFDPSFVRAAYPAVIRSWIGKGSIPEGNE